MEYISDLQGIVIVARINRKDGSNGRVKCSCNLILIGLRIARRLEGKMEKCNWRVKKSKEKEKSNLMA